jgi:hypothetical protein
MITTNTARAAYIPTARATRTRVGSHMSPARRYAVLDAFVARVNVGLVTTAEYLANVIGADAAFVAKYSGVYGKAVAKVFRAEFGTEPRKAGLARRRTMLLSVFAYAADELPILDKAARTYGRTADLLAA